MVSHEKNNGSPALQLQRISAVDDSNCSSVVHPCIQRSTHLYYGSPEFGDLEVPGFRGPRLLFDHRPRWPSVGRVSSVPGSSESGDLHRFPGIWGPRPGTSSSASSLTPLAIRRPCASSDPSTYPPGPRNLGTSSFACSLQRFRWPTVDLCVQRSMQLFSGSPESGDLVVPGIWGPRLLRFQRSIRLSSGSPESGDLVLCLFALSSPLAIR